MNATAKDRSATATVLGVNGNIVRVQVVDGRIMKNEVAYVCVGDERLKAEVLRVNGERGRLASVRGNRWHSFRRRSRTDR